MSTSFLYQFSDFTFHQVDLKEKLPVYLRQAEKVTGNEDKITCRWVVRSKPSILLAKGDTEMEGVAIIEKG